MEFTPDLMLNRIGIAVQNQKLTVCYPHFMGSKFDLSLTAFKVSGKYYAHDNGCVLAYLKEKGKEKQFTGSKDALCRYFGCAFIGDRFWFKFGEKYGFYEFLKRLIFLIGIDVISPYLEPFPYFEPTDDLPKWGEEGLEDISELASYVRKRAHRDGDGFLVSTGIHYSDSDKVGSSIFFIQREDGRILLTDGQRSDRFERVVLERVEFDRNGYARYDGRISEICRAYGIEYADHAIFAVSKAQTEVLLDAYFRFLQAAVILSEVGQGGMLE